MEHDRKGHSANLRRGRYSEHGRIYLVTTSAFQRRPIFEDLYLGRLVVRCLAAEFHASTLCYVLMPDHMHWLVQLNGDHGLPRTVGRVKSQSAKLIGRRIHCKGRIWQDGFHDRAIRREQDLRSIARYIAGNPVRAGITESAKSYPLWDAIWL